VITVCLLVVNARRADSRIRARGQGGIRNPAADKPGTYRVSGVFITAGERSQTCIRRRQRGYLYFTLPKVNDDLALREWADLKSIAGRVR